MHAICAILLSLAKVLGIITLSPDQWFRLAKPVVATAATADAELADTGPEQGSQGSAPNAALVSDAEVERLIEARIAARKAKDFAESDRIRDELAAAGVIVEDKPGGKSTWRRA